MLVCHYYLHVAEEDHASKVGQRTSQFIVGQEPEKNYISLKSKPYKVSTPGHNNLSQANILLNSACLFFLLTSD